MDRIVFLVLIYKLSSSNFHTVRNLIFNNLDRDREESIVMLYIAFFTAISVELN